MRKGGLRNVTRGGQQARQQAAHRLPQKSRRMTMMRSGRTCSETLVFVDDVNGGIELDKHLVIEGSQVKIQGGKIISTRWVDTDKGYRGNANCRSRPVAREIKKDKRQDLFSATPPLETLKLLVADCATKGQRQAKPFRIGIVDVSRRTSTRP